MNAEDEHRREVAAAWDDAARERHRAEVAEAKLAAIAKLVDRDGVRLGYQAMEAVLEVHAILDGEPEPFTARQVRLWRDQAFRYGGRLAAIRDLCDAAEAHYGDRTVAAIREVLDADQ
jgi:hypothetical protein